MEKDIKVEILENVALGNDLTPNQVRFLKGVFEVTASPVRAGNWRDELCFDHEDGHTLRACGIDEDYWEAACRELVELAMGIARPDGSSRVSEMVEAVMARGSEKLVALLVVRGVMSMGKG